MTGWFGPVKGNPSPAKAAAAGTVKPITKVKPVIVRTFIRVSWPIAFDRLLDCSVRNTALI
jgi:hypothetical protein